MLSQLLFDCFIKKVINIVKSKLIGIQIRKKNYLHEYMREYTNDIVLIYIIANGKGDIQCVTDKIKVTLETLEMKINEKMTN